jgi:hypothetical protein
MASTSDTSVRARLERLDRNELASDGLRSRAGNTENISASAAGSFLFALRFTARELAAQGILFERPNGTTKVVP